LENLAIQIGQYEETLLDLELQQREKESQLEQSYRTAVEQLVNAISSWELSYCLISPIRGIVTSAAYWNENQHVNAGDVVFSIVPDGEGTLIGKALLPMDRSGKVKAGQRVIVRFNNFPDQEFGIVNGELVSISLVPNENNYMAEIRFPNGLETNYGLSLPLSHEMKASAEIVTAELRLIERFFMPVKKELKEGFVR
jgi:HlyD family secretion protein